jgi:PAS domain S-box-containing protein
MQDHGRMINLAGSERKRAFEIVYHLQNIHEYDRDRLEELRSHIQDLEEVFYALRDGSEKWDMPQLRVENEQARKSIDELIKKWHGEIKPYIEGAEKALKEGDVSSYISNTDRYAELVHDYVHEIGDLVNILVDDYRKDLKVHDVNMIVFFVIMAISSLIVFIYFRRTALAPLQSLSETASVFGKGELGVRETVKGNDEVGELAMTFNMMADSIEREVENLAEAQRIAHLGNWDWDIVNNELYWSDEIYRIFGLMPKKFEANYEAFLNAVHPEDRESVIKAVDRTLYEKHPYSIEHRIVLPDGRERVVHGQAEVTFDDNGKPVRMLGTVQDITDHKRMEDQVRESKKMDSIGRLAGGVAHDFNNLMSAVLGYSHLILSKLPEDDPMAERVGMIKKAGEKAAALTTQLLAFSRRQVLRTKVINLNTVVDDMSKLLTRMIGEDVKLELQTHANLMNVMADRNQIEQILMNLAVNARDAMPQGGVLKIGTSDINLNEDFAETYPGVKTGPYVLLSVADTGVGISPEVKENIFEPFFTTKGTGEGTGLGLSTVYGIVKQHNGHIFVDSKLNAGSIFKIYLPSVRAEVAEEEEPEPAAEARMTCTLLVVEDEPMVLKMVVDTLEHLGCRVLTASSPDEAVRISDSFKEGIDAFLIDVVLPSMNGRKLSELLKDRRPGAKTIYMSGYADEVIMRGDMIEPGMNFIPKPLTPGKIFSKLSQVLELGN